MSEINIVFLDAHTLNPGDLTWERLESLGNFSTYDRTESEDILPRASEADVLIINKIPLTEAEFSALPRLRLVCVAATGYDVVDVAAARRHGISVCNCAGYGTVAVAQMAVAHLLEVTNRVGSYACQNREGFWANSRDFCCWNEPLTELTGKRFCVVGYGAIGRAITNLLRPFGLQLYAVTTKEAKELPADVQKISLREAFSTLDIVSLNVPLTSNNRAFVNAELLALAKRGLILINTARGALIDEQAVCDALSSGQLGAYCADVLAEEPPCPDHPLLSAPNAYITPHIAWATADARQRIIGMIAENISEFLQSGLPKQLVN